MWALFGAAFCASPAGSLTPARSFEPGAATPTAADLERRALPEDEYAESLTYVLYLQDGRRVEAGFSVTNLGIGSGNGSFNAQVVAPGQNLQLRGDVKHSFRWQSTPLLIEMGSPERGLRLRTTSGTPGQSGHTVELSASAPDFSYRLHVHALMPAWRPGSGQIHFGDRVLQYMVQVPRGELSGEVTAQGRRSAVSGVAFVEHVRTNADPRRQTDRQLRLRFFDQVDEKPLTLLSFDLLTPPKDGARRFGFLVIFLGSQVVYETADPVLTSLDLHPDPLRPQNQVPARYRIQLAAPNGVDVDAKVMRLLERSDYLDQLSGFLRAIVARFLHPVSYNHDCAAQVKLTLATLQTTRRGWADCSATLARP